LDRHFSQPPHVSNYVLLLLDCKPEL